MFFNKNSLGTTCLFRGIVRKPACDMPVGETEMEEELKFIVFHLVDRDSGEASFGNVFVL